MYFRILSGFLLTVAFAIPSGPLPAQDDSVAKKSAVEDSFEKADLAIFDFEGGSMPGKLIDQPRDDDGRTYAVIQTPGGGFLKLDRGRAIKSIREVNEYDTRYMAQLSRVDTSTVAGNWAMYDWIQDQDGGKARFQRQRDYHLRKITSIDPNDERARKLLGYEQVNGVWLHPEHKFANHGYVKITGGWVPELQLKLIEENRQSEDVAQARRAQFKKWHRMIGKAPANILQQELMNIADPYTVVPIFEEAKDERNERLRLLYVDAIGKVDSGIAIDALIFFAIRDPSRSVRDRSLTLLKQEMYDPRQIVSRITSKYLKSHIHRDVVQSGYVLAEIGDPSAVIDLIPALQTTHEIDTGADPNRINSSFNGDGAFQFGNKTPPKISRTLKNQSVLDALRRLTEKDFGYDEAAWGAWYINEKTLYRINVRVDE